MKLAVMQPYLFPYFGYFQLIAAVDAFVVYDDVAFIKQGWINRNRLKIGGQAKFFTVPIANISSNRSIRDTQIAAVEYDRWLPKYLTTVSLNYRLSPHFQVIYPLVENLFREKVGSVAELARNSILLVMEYLGIHTRVVASSSLYSNAGLERAARLKDICRREGATHYYNLPGGAALYRKDDFATAGIALSFLSPRSLTYLQPGHQAFIPNLSILDVLMNVERSIVCEHLKEFDLL
ncbi:MAG: WbqC family protein [Verrucomicrobia bacterium]|jgi:hypothetical protein|nr:WbqC family protein [Verrucomicrobiota bacterium]